MPEVLTRAGDPLFLCFTSGTTSRPKTVAYTHSSYPVGHLSGMFWNGLRPGDTHLNICVPGWAEHAWSSFFVPWNAGATVVAPTGPRPAAPTSSTRCAPAPSPASAPRPPAGAACSPKASARCRRFCGRPPAPGSRWRRPSSTALVTAGVELDVLGIGYDEITDGQRAAVVAAHPRPDFKRRILQAFNDGIAHRPDTTFGDIKADVLARYTEGYVRPNFVDVITESRWPE